MSNAHDTQYKPTHHPGKDKMCVCMYACLYPPFKSRATASVAKKNLWGKGGAGPAAAGGGCFWKTKKQKEEGS